MDLTPFQQIIIALRFYATGSYYRLVGDSFGISVASLARFVDRVSLALCYITRQFITFPVGRESSEIKRCFTILRNDFTIRAIFPFNTTTLEFLLLPVPVPSIKRLAEKGRKQNIFLFLLTGIRLFLKARKIDNDHGDRLNQQFLKKLQ
ncbi:hypothetical protein KUTeg_006774 [Tegillarca granosa]|uniref:Transposase Helix-turn-helix domain-containing protein n=1 Tax=Tegillarca granosa TaxID=220873 RepID=A0ABQ9FBA6_TEGGR|nr:hypothetical protein KUTeg_006774 [Tegillarca granosa]